MKNTIKKIGIACALKKLKHTIFLDADSKDLCARNGACEYLKRYAYACDYTKKEWRPTPKPNTIWTCWWQGEEQAPLLVQKCLKQLRKYSNGYDVIVIDENNLNQYVTLPEYIYKKHSEGIISHTHFSDVIRLALLSKWGGTWIDSTIFLTDVLPDFILNADLFFFKKDGAGSVYMANSFISAVAHHPVIDDVLALHYAYWERENRLVSYSIFHLFTTIAIFATPLNKQLWDNMPLVYSSYLDLLQPQLNKAFDRESYETIKSLASIHKLTYKFDSFKIDTTVKNTFYDVLINRDGQCE